MAQKDLRLRRTELARSLREPYHEVTTAPSRQSRSKCDTSCGASSADFDAGDRRAVRGIPHLEKDSF